MNGHSHHHNGYSQGLASADMLLAQHQPKQAHQGMSQMTSNSRAVSHDPPGWNGRYEM